MAEGGIGLSAVLCDLCENEPAQSFCRTCSGNLCDKCTTEHKSKKIFYRHDVVKMTLTREMEKDGYGYCREHPESKYELCCRDCTVPVCTKCIAGLHNGHKMHDISSAYIEAKSKITSKVTEIETTQYPEHRKHLDDLDIVLNDINRKTNDMEQTVNVDLAWIRGSEAKIKKIDIQENINQDICVSDVFRHSIIVVDRSGFFRFAYSGGGIHESREDFCPTELDTDSMGNIAVSDNGNNLVHLLDIDGNLVKYLLTSSDGISEPRGLKVDSEDRLWLTEVRTGYVKIFKYLD
ncbi:E3 ubiquitin-protein ligase TRIM45-like [Saccostrea echinata]|uniref:E3 ubiquitin-protein ligase TRIM45-like n=1 Tax=Saccostrea echinata TaxID=191078 RepID=UPI002A800FE7|nr:E3 ubiquitin-protein ligase TRIM45-like [Saccostrea echinata]